MTAIDDYLQSHRDAHLEELKDLLRIPSVSTNPAHKPDIQKAANFVADKLRDLDFDVTIHETPGHPIVYGEWLNAPGAPTVLIYGHYDVQPPDPLELWRNPPFEPTIENGNIVARGATDDKGQMYCHIKGVEAHIKTAGKLPINVKFLIEGEEEVGSDNLDPFLTANAEMLAADSVLISDTSMFGVGQPALTVGLRGLAYFDVEVQGPSHDLHSGLYGGAVKNPINALCEMIATLHDDKGRITVDGFYDSVQALSDADRADMAALNHDEAGFKKEAGLQVTVGEAGYTVLEQISARPTLDCNGIWGGYIEPGAKTVLPAQAFAKMSCRLVPDQDPVDVENKLRAHLEKVCPAGVSVKLIPHHGGTPFLVDRNGPAVIAASRALARVWGVDPVFMRSGGSIPVVASFKNLLGIDSVLMGLGLADDRLHSPNEKFGLENYFNGIRSSAYVIEELAAGE